MKRLIKQLFFLIVTLAGTYTSQHASFYSVPSTIFAPGAFESEQYAALYSPLYHASNGQTVSCSRSKPFILGPCSSVNFDDIVFTGKRSALAQFIGSIIEKKRNALFKNDACIYTEPTDPSFLVDSYVIDPSRFYFGQKRDVEQFTSVYNRHAATYPEDGIVLYGFSRGAATVFNFITSLPEHERARIQAVILEACPDSLEHLLQETNKRLYQFPGGKQLTHAIFSLTFPNVNMQGMVPLNSVADFPRDVPVLFISSLKDKTVPYECSYRLYHALKKAGHPYVHLVTLKNSSHPGYVLDDEEDSNTYLCAVHAFYKRYGLAHDPELATRGEYLLD